jgi:Glyoxalase superfamily protein
MSRSLPSRPHIEHLRKQAKALLAELQRQHPETQLAEAQRRLARAHGFSTWAALKAHVVARMEAGAPGPASVTDRLHPLDGVWRVDPERSTFPPETTHRNALLRLGVTGDEVTIAEVADDDVGPRSHTMTLVADGRLREQAFGFAITVRWTGPAELEAVVTRNAEPEGQTRYSLAEGGRLLRLEYRRASDPSGEGRVAVFERVIDG